MLKCLVLFSFSYTPSPGQLNCACSLRILTVAGGNPAPPQTCSLGQCELIRLTVQSWTNIVSSQFSLRVIINITNPIHFSRELHRYKCHMLEFHVWIGETQENSSRYRNRKSPSQQQKHLTIFQRFNDTSKRFTSDSLTIYTRSRMAEFSP